jgi:uncharacterized caspase-like protein
MRDLFPDLRHGSGAEVITASDGLQLAQESQELGNGVFTKAVLEGLRDGDADSDKNGQITISELSVFVQKRVLELTGGQQRPTARRDTLEFDFPLLLR